MDLKLGMHVITQHVDVHFQVSITLHCENILNFVTFYNKKRPKIERILVCKIHILQVNSLKLSENVYFNKAHLKI